MSCDSFLTGGSFRAIHQQHKAENDRLLAAARRNENVRLIEVLEQDGASLAHILEGLEAIDADHPDRAEPDLLATPTTLQEAT